jgi:hypothetical protein
VWEGRAEQEQCYGKFHGSDAIRHLSTARYFQRYRCSFDELALAATPTMASKDKDKVSGLATGAG